MISGRMGWRSFTVTSMLSSNPCGGTARNGLRMTRRHQQSNSQGDHLVARSSRRSQQQQRNSEMMTMEDAKRWRDMSPKEKVVFATKQTTYTGISLFGLGVTGAIAYMVVSELVSPGASQAMYSRALDLIKENERAVELLGEPIAGYRENNRRGRWRRFDEYAGVNGGPKTAFMRFGISGSVNQATVNAWMEEKKDGWFGSGWEFTHLNVELGERGRPTARIVIADRRSTMSSGEESPSIEVAPGEVS